MAGDWIKLYRKLLDSREFKNPELLHTWVYCLLKASWKKRWISVTVGKGQTEVEILPGQFIFGRLVAARETGQKPSSIWKRMLKLEKLRNLDIQRNSHYSIVTILNWELYQGSDGDGEQPTEQAGDNQGTGKEQAGDTNNKDKTEKKGKKGNTTPPTQDPQFEIFWQGVPNKLGKGKARAAWAKAIKTTPPETILAGLPKYQEYERRRMSDEGYRPLHPTTWINGERWEDELESRPGPRLPGASEPAMSQCELCRKPYPMGGDPVCDCRMCPCCKRLREARFFDGGHDDCEICRNPRGA